MACSLISVYFDSLHLGIQKRKKLYATLDYWSRDTLNFDVLKKGLGIVPLPHFVYGFWQIMFLMLYFINWPNSIVWLSLLLEILGNMCIAFIWFTGCDVISLETNLIFLIKPFFYMTKNSIQKFNILRWNKKNFSSFLKGFQSINFLRHKSATLSIGSHHIRFFNTLMNNTVVISFTPFFTHAFGGDILSTTLTSTTGQ